MTARFRSKNIAEGRRPFSSTQRSALAVSALVSNLLLAGTFAAAQTGQAPNQAGTPNRVPQAKQPASASPAAPAPASVTPATPLPAANGAPPAKGPLTPPADYIIGPDDVLSIVYWREKDLTADVTVRPDGKISLPLLNDIQAAGLTPSQLRDRLTEESRKYVQDPNVTVVVHTINSRKVYITGEVGKPGPYVLTGPTTVLQLIATAGGLGTYADAKRIVIVRNENGRQVTYPFNYHDVATRKSLKQNIYLQPEDVVIVP